MSKTARVRVVPVAMVRELLMQAFDAKNDPTVTPREYATQIVNEIAPPVRTKKVLPFATIWAWDGGDLKEIAVVKENASSYTLAEKLSYWEPTAKKYDEGQKWFRTKRAAIERKLQSAEYDVRYHGKHAEEAAADVFVYGEALKELEES